VNWLSNGQVLAEDKARGGENRAANIWYVSGFLLLATPYSVKRWPFESQFYMYIPPVTWMTWPVI
jgi:hypothetical protein